MESELVKLHPAHGYEVVKKTGLPWQIPEMIYQHHERLDGSGYPKGIQADQIIMENRILSVAEVVEAMSAHRPYRPALGLDTALMEIKIFSGIKFDAEVVDTCIKLFRIDLEI